MANTNYFGQMLGQPQPTRSYTRQSGVTSGLGQPQAMNRQTCPTGYRYDTTQARCVAVNQPTAGFWNKTAQGITQPSGQNMTTQTQNQTQAPKFQTQPMPRANQLSPYAQLLAAAVDLNPATGGFNYQGQQSNTWEPWQQPMTITPVPGGTFPQQRPQLNPDAAAQLRRFDEMRRPAPMRSGIGQQLGINERLQRLVLGR